MPEEEITKPKQVLVIDDDITALDIVAYLFEEKGYDVVRYADGHSAIDYLKDANPDIIIIDLMMPNINGVDTVKHIRSNELSVAPILAFTAVDEEKLHNEARDAGCNEVITKPCPTEKLLKYLNKYLSS